MIQVNIEQHTEGQLAGKWDIHVYDGSEHGDLLVFSNQGYENRSDAEHVAQRLFGPSENLHDEPAYEHVDLAVKFADGTGNHQMLR